MKRRLLDLHLYLGLLCAPYLVVYGVSAISFNHDWVTTPWTSEWEASATGNSSATDAEQADEVQRALGLWGFIPAKSVARDEASRLSFVVNRPGRSYRVSWSAQQSSARIEETHRGVVDVLRGLHGLRRMNGAPLSVAWGLYSELSVWVMIFAVATGIYLYSSRGDWIGWSLLGGGSAVFAALAVAVW